MADKHAYLILAHKNPWQISRLLSMLDDRRNDIFMHIDAKASFDVSELKNACHLSSLHFIEPRISVNWGGASIMYDELALIKASVPEHYSYYHLLSGMDLPIKNQDYIHRFFDDNSGKVFINFWKIKSHTRNRFSYYTIFPEGTGKFLHNLANNIVKGILMLFRFKINKDVDFKYGSQWFSITDEAARFILSREEWLIKTFRHTNTCDEVFIPTLLWNSPYRVNIYDQTEYTENSALENISNLRLIDWSRGKSIRHPWVFTIDDLDMIRNAPQLWARKFDENVDREIITEICRLYGKNGE